VEPFELSGPVVRLEPLGEGHASRLVAAAAEDPGLYQWQYTPQGTGAVLAYIAEALAGLRDGHMVPFAVVRQQDDAVVGTTRYNRIEYWAWPAGTPHFGRETPDVCEIGNTWLARSALRTAVNTGAKLLLLQYAFETWLVHRVALRTDVRNSRSQAAIERLGAHLDGTIRGERLAADATVRDSKVYSITAAEWPAVKERLVALQDR
jgi:RimJ/RimL family protein N-acetyltransferase